MASFARKAARSGLWFAGFKFSTQLFSWVVTIAVARILVPADYGLMAMASILTGYLEIFSELGLGAAIIQKREISKEEVSSVFWFSVTIGAILAVVTYFLSYPTAWMFREPRVIPITRLISVIFIISAAMIVPYSLLTREVRFKEIGAIQFTAVGISSVSMLFMAREGFGVWTLIFGVIIQRLINAILTFRVAKWRPSWHYSFSDAKPFLRFGINVAGSRSLFYIFQKTDKFIVGRLFDAASLGLYSFALQLAASPTEKIVSIVNQVAFPVLSRCQDDPGRMRDIYTKITKYIVLLVAPLFLGGALFARQIVTGVLGEKWEPIVFMFQLFCIAQFLESLASINGIVHSALGKPNRGMVYTLLNVLIMPPAVFVAGRFGFEYLALPWVAVYPLLAIGWIIFTVRTLGISKKAYAVQLVRPVLATFLIVAGARLFQSLLAGHAGGATFQRTVLAAAVIVCAALYASYLYLFEKSALSSIAKLRRQDNEGC